MLIPATLLAAVLALLAWFARKDRSAYAAFKALTRTEDRQRVLRLWAWRPALVFTGAALAVLLAIGRLDALIHIPTEFGGLIAPSDGGGDGDEIGWDFLIGMLAAPVIGGVIGVAIRSWLRRRKPSARPPRSFGDIEPLFPRNREERRWTALMAINAGPSEELFFRLMLPLLIALVTGDALIAFAAAGLIFGLVHFYQGWVGILATTIFGFGFAFLYLATGSIWIAAVIHSLFNLNSLWLRPLLKERNAERSRAKGALARAEVEP